MDNFFQSKYCYKNKLNITDGKIFNKKELEITDYKLSIINKSNIQKTYDINHYLSIHKFLFDDIYSFAGELRDENIYKSRAPYKEGVMPFCEIPFIKKTLIYTLSEMNQNYIKIKNREDLLKFLAHYYLELNIIHPFREGNGRTLNVFTKEYVERINKDKGFNFVLDYDMDEETKELSKKSTRLDDEVLAYKVFDKMVYEKELKDEKNFTL